METEVLRYEHLKDALAQKGGEDAALCDLFRDILAPLSVSERQELVRLLRKTNRVLLTPA